MQQLLAAILSLTLFSATIQPFQAATAAETAKPAANTPLDVPAALCLPDVYLYEPGDCLAAGPSAYINRMAQDGIHLPIAPFAYSKTDPALGAVDVRYGEVRNMPAPIYSSLDEAMKGGKKSVANRLNGNFVFISYTNEQEVNGRRFYEVEAGQWMVANDISRLGVIPAPLGLTFTSTPTMPFAWVLTYFTQNGYLETKRTPGNDIADYTGRRLNLYDIVPVFGEQDVDGEMWYRIGPEEWAPAKFVARVKPNSTPPQGVTGDRWIEVNLFDQTLAVYDKRQLVFATVIASGAEPFWTQPGVFQIFEKHESTPMRGAMGGDNSDAYYLEDVPWTMYFDGARALHGAYWRAKMGFVQSHGCVNLTVGDAHWLFNWAQMGDWVYVWDPSGKTPIDPALYTSGGY